MVTVEFKGLDKMVRKLNARINRIERQIMKKALEAFAEPIRAEAERSMRQQISPRIQVGVTVVIRRSTGRVRIGPTRDTFRLTPSGRTVTSAMLGYFFEFGYHIRETAKGPSLVFVGSRPSLTPAYESRKAQGLAAMHAVLRAGFEQEVAA